ncbi:hypothetical protein [Micromonospora sp. C31]|uniref:hypothetical protein n=1 Tax=Micromonospora sp. C31 TaxID=2824876 RepID=UPI001FFD9096|nr:hypothetical protein [Micromonospora sp. C31]
MAAAPADARSDVVPADRTVGGHHATRGRRIVAALAITQTVGYGTLHYAYPHSRRAAADGTGSAARGSGLLRWRCAD